MKELFSYVKRWRELERDSKALDYRKTVFARDLRAEFATDESFRSWCEFKLGITTHQVDELLTRALAAKVTDDEKTYRSVGGFSAIRSLVGVDKPDQIRVLQSAKQQNKSIRSVMREQGLIEAPPPSTLRTDIEAMARFVLASDAPKDVKAIARKYIAEATKRAA